MMQVFKSFRIYNLSGTLILCFLATGCADGNGFKLHDLNRKNDICPRNTAAAKIHSEC